MTSTSTPDAVTISVADTGQGMTAEQLAHIFERFYRGEGVRHTNGSGLGLAIAKDLVNAHGGNISAAGFHIVLRADADCFDSRLRANHVSHRGNKLGRKMPMRHQHKTNHQLPRLNSSAVGQSRSLRRPFRFRFRQDHDARA